MSIKQCFDHLNKIVDRAHRIYVENGVDIDREQIVMALLICHEDVCPLKLKEMAEWPRDSDLMHDVAGILNHLDPETKQLRDCFLPRFAV